MVQLPEAAVSLMPLRPRVPGTIVRGRMVSRKKALMTRELIEQESEGEGEQGARQTDRGHRARTLAQRKRGTA